MSWNFVITSGLGMCTLPRDRSWSTELADDGRRRIGGPHYVCEPLQVYKMLYNR